MLFLLVGKLHNRISAKQPPSVRLGCPFLCREKRQEYLMKFTFIQYFVISALNSTIEFALRGCVRGCQEGMALHPQGSSRRAHSLPEKKFGEN